MIKYIATSIFIYTLLLSGALFYFFDRGLGIGLAVGVLLGGLTVFVSVGGLALYWHLILAKKLIAFAALIIIFKYLILIGILWSVYSLRWISPIGFCLGLSSLIVSLVVAVVVKRFENQNVANH